jgi:hypothetical protein
MVNSEEPTAKEGAGRFSSSIVHYQVAIHIIEKTRNGRAMLKVVEYLRSGRNLGNLETAFAITPRWHGKFHNLVLLKYSQINSPMAERIVQECRGIILDAEDNWRPVSIPYFKFFNYGEPNAAPIDWQSARVFEKLDGSLMTLYYYAGQWQVASSGMPDASGPTGFGMTFAELFWKTWQECGLELPQDVEFCYMFEMMTPFNRIVVPHKSSRIVAHGARRLSEPYPEIDIQGMPWPAVQSFPLNTLENVLASCAAINPLESEGYVVCDAHFNRVKVKSPQYVALAHMKDAMSPRGMLELIRANESDEVLTYFPEFRPLYEAVRERFEALVAKLEAEYAAIQDISEQKAFAMAAVKSRFSSPLFAVRNGKSQSIRKHLSECKLQSLERAMPIDDLMDSVAGGASE